MEKKSVVNVVPQAATQDCFVIMPIADCDGYEKGHFSKVYEDIFKPACLLSGFSAIRADEVKQTNLIHLDILQKLIDSPMAICDLSSRNPNVLFELGLRQAFDKPTVLVQEAGTPKIFDIAPLRYTEYRKELRYRDVLEDQQLIASSISATKNATENGEGVNSIVRILSLAKPATLKEVAEGDSSGLLQLVRAEMSEMRSDFRRAMHVFEANGVQYAMPNMPSSNSRRRVLMEVRESLAEAEYLYKIEAPLEVIISITSAVQKKLSKFIDIDGPKEFRDEARSLFMQADNIEVMAASRGKT